MTATTDEVDEVLLTEIREARNARRSPTNSASRNADTFRADR
jgi:hypothetical protein